MKLIVGLGNPGFKYRATRHNVGFMVLDNIASRFGIRLKKRLFNSLCGAGKINGTEVVLAKPLTYMNLSGRAVCEIKEKEDISLDNILIIMDDADLGLGQIRLRLKGSPGGHRGLRSIIEELGTEEVARLKIGIGPRSRGRLLSDYVLASFNKTEKVTLNDSIERCSLCAEAWVKEGADSAMNSFNS